MSDGKGHDELAKLEALRDEFAKTAMLAHLMRAEVLFESLMQSERGRFVIARDAYRMAESMLMVRATL